MWHFAQTTTNLYGQTSSSSPVWLLYLYIAIAVVIIFIMWRVFEKAGQAGWKAIIPIYNTVILLRIAGMSGWFTLLFFVPFVNAIMSIIVAYKIAKAFGYNIGMTILLIFGIGYAVLAFNGARYTPLPRS